MIGRTITWRGFDAYAARADGGSESVNVQIDFLSAGGHKWLLGPIGTGFFYCRKGSLDRLHPSVVGYHSVDKSEDHMDYELIFRDGAARFEEALVNFPGIWGLKAAADTLAETGMEKIEAHILNLTKHASAPPFMSTNAQRPRFTVIPLPRRSRSAR